MRVKNFLYCFLFFLSILCSCDNNKDYNSDLLSNEKNKIIKACYEIGEKRDTSYIKNLLNRSLDPRITHNVKYIGASVNNVRLSTLQKISNYAYKQKIKQHQVDTAATFFFLNWAIKNRHLKNDKEVDINFHHPQ